jgi:hypothetical protein
MHVDSIPPATDHGKASHRIIAFMQHLFQTDQIFSLQIGLNNIGISKYDRLPFSEGKCDVSSGEEGRLGRKDLRTEELCSQLYHPNYFRDP